MTRHASSLSPAARAKLVLASQRGEFGLVEVLVGVAVMGMLAIGALAMFNFTAGAINEQDPKTPAPTKTPPAEIDLSWLWQVGGAIALLAVAAGLVFGGYVLWKKVSTAQRRILAERAHAETLVRNAVAALDTVVLESASYDIDLAKQIDFPLMSDATDPAVAAYLKDMRRAMNLRSLASRPGLPSLDSATTFADAVNTLEISFNGAVAKAERIRWSSFTEAEKSKLKDARTALAVIHDASTTPEQRNAQYRRITKLLEGLITITAPALRELSALVPMLVLEAAQDRRPQAA